MADRTLTVRVIGDDRDLQRMFDRQSRQIQGQEARFVSLGTAVRGAFAAAGIAVGIQQAFAIVRGAVNDATALNEEVAKSREIFGASSDEIEEWSETTASSLGISQRAALEATGTFGNLFAVVGLAPETSAAMSQALVQLAADLASFNNASPEDVLQAIRSGLIGEAEPLRRYGVLLSEARVQQQALVNTGKENVKALTDQEKAQARYQIILEDTAKAQGDVERTSGSLANQSRQLSANLEDLSADIGGLLLPALTGIVTIGNEAFAVLDRIAGVQISEGLDVGDLAGYIGGWKTISFLIEKAKGDAEDLAGVQFPTFLGPDDRPGPRGPGAIDARNRAIEATRSAQGARDFEEFLRGMELKLDRAEITKGTADDLAVLDEIERAIQRRIRREGRTFELVTELTRVRSQRASLLEQQAADAAQASRDAYAEVIGSLELELGRALRTASLEDDLQALEEIERAIRRRIEQEGRTLELLEQLADVEERQAEVRRQQRERRRTRRQERQFEALGLTAEGDERTPGRRTLLRRANTLEEQIKGTTLDTRETRAQLDRIQAVLSGKFGEVGRNVRAAAERMLDEIAAGLSGEGRRTGRETKFQKTGIEKLVEDLGLTPEQIKELRQRFSRVGPGGTVPTTGQAAFGAAVTDANRIGMGGGIVIENRVFIEGIEQKVTKSQQKRRSRSAAQRRGVRPGVG